MIDIRSMLSLIHVDRNFADGLDAIGVEQNALFSADFPNFLIG